MNVKLKEKIRESLSAVLPITGIVLMLSIFLIPMELGSVVMFLTGALMLIVGMGFFQLGAEMAMTALMNKLDESQYEISLYVMLAQGELIKDIPPSLISIVTAVAPASIAFSTSSFTTDDGLSITSPAAILLIVS